AKAASENVKVPFVNITGFVDLMCPKPDGVDLIKAALAAAAIDEGDEVTLTVRYVGAPRYRLQVTAPDYKLAEKVLKGAAERAIDKIHRCNGTGTFHRHEEPANA
ncbi:MAG: translation initiation factor IF-2 subunit alpha, partial [Methanosarcinales archaeon]|nr:translation initiation factor IF-2 subunit alpha [Methanosarcinales archaeon]